MSQTFYQTTFSNLRIRVQFAPNTTDILVSVKLEGKKPQKKGLTPAQIGDYNKLTYPEFVELMSSLDDDLMLENSPLTLIGRTAILWVTATRDKMLKNLVYEGRFAKKLLRSVFVEPPKPHPKKKL